MVCWWKIDSYFNSEQSKFCDIGIITAEYGSSGSFGSRVISNYIGYNIYTGRRINFRLNPTPMHGQVHKYGLNYSYSRSHFSWLPQPFSKGLIYRLSHKLSYVYKIIDPVINRFSPN